MVEQEVIRLFFSIAAHERLEVYARDTPQAYLSTANIVEKNYITTEEDLDPEVYGKRIVKVWCGQKSYATA